MPGKLFSLGQCGFALSAAFFLDDLVSNVVAGAAGLGRFADVAGFLVEFEHAFCEVGPVIGSGFWIRWFGVEVAFPVVLAVYLLPGDFKDDLQDVAELFDADRGVAVHRSPFWLANPWF